MPGSRREAGASTSRGNAGDDVCTLKPHAGGYVAEGPGFYVWDLDPGEVIRVADALRRGCFEGSQTARYLVIGAEEPIRA